MTGPSWDLRAHDDGDQRVVTVSGELDLLAAPELESRLVESLEATPSAVGVDLADVTYIDSSAVRALMRAAMKAEQTGKTLRVVRASGVTRRVLEVAGVTEVLGLEAAD